MTGPETKIAIVLFAKEPRIGENKSRLAKDIGWEIATEIYSSMAHDIWNTMLSTGYPCVLSSDREKAWLPDCYKSIPQPAGNFATRIKLVLDEIYQDGFNAVVALGADTPQLSGSTIDAAVNHLKQGVELVTSPSDDGGLVLLGLSLPPEIDLTVMPFETDQLSDRFDEAGKDLNHVRLLPGLYDIDMLDDLIRLKKDEERFRDICPQTLDAISNLGEH